MAPAKANTFVPLLRSVPLRGIPIAALENNGGHVGVRFDVVQDGGFAPESLHGGERRTRARLAAVAFDRGQQRGFFAANECARAHADFEIEIELRAEDVLAQ